MMYYGKQAGPIPCISSSPREIETNRNVDTRKKRFFRPDTRNLKGYKALEYRKDNISSYNRYKPFNYFQEHIAKEYDGNDFSRENMGHSGTYISSNSENVCASPDAFDTENLESDGYNQDDYDLDVSHQPQIQRVYYSRETTRTPYIENLKVYAGGEGFQNQEENSKAEEGHGLNHGANSYSCKNAYTHANNTGSSYPVGNSPFSSDEERVYVNQETQIYDQEPDGQFSNFPETNIIRRDNERWNQYNTPANGRLSQCSCSSPECVSAYKNPSHNKPSNSYTQGRKYQSHKETQPKIWHTHTQAVQSPYSDSPKSSKYSYPPDYRDGISCARSNISNGSPESSDQLPYSVGIDDSSPSVIAVKDFKAMSNKHSIENSFEDNRPCTVLNCRICSQSQNNPPTNIYVRNNNLPEIPSYGNDEMINSPSYENSESPDLKIFPKVSEENAIVWQDVSLSLPGNSEEEIMANYDEILFDIQSFYLESVDRLNSKLNNTMTMIFSDS